MSIKSTVSTPTPRADYTERYNRHLDNLQHRDTHRAVEKNQKGWQEHYQWRREHVNEQHRLDRAHQRRLELEQIHQYEVLMNKQSYQDYRYQFYIGTLFDTYI